MMLICKLCGNDIEFVVIGTHGYGVTDVINGSGIFTYHEDSNDTTFTTYSRIGCRDCDADTEDIEGAEEWLKKNP